MKKILLLVMAVVFTQPLAYTQPTDPNYSDTFVLFENSTRLSDQATVFRAFDKYDRVIFNKLVDEGAILGFGHMTHVWGDEYNHNVYVVAENKQTFFTAIDRYASELYEMVGSEEIADLQAKVLKHKDNIYTHTAYYYNEAARGRNIVMRNLNNVSFANQAEWVRLFREYCYPILKEMVDAGTINAFGLLLHDFGDEWNTNYYILANDLPSFNSAWGEFISTLNERHPNVLPQLVDMTDAHKDNLLNQRVPAP